MTTKLVEGLGSLENKLFFMVLLYESDEKYTETQFVGFVNIVESFVVANPFFISIALIFTIKTTISNHKTKSKFARLKDGEESTVLKSARSNRDIHLLHSGNSGTYFCSLAEEGTERMSLKRRRQLYM